MFLLLRNSSVLPLSFFFFFNDTATTEIYTLSLHDALPISCFAIASVVSAMMRASSCSHRPLSSSLLVRPWPSTSSYQQRAARSEEHTSELQSRPHLVCRLLLEKKKKIPDAAIADLQLRVYR